MLIPRSHGIATGEVSSVSPSIFPVSETIEPVKLPSVLGSEEKVRKVSFDDSPPLVQKLPFVTHGQF